jgi:hypothetical protein
MSSIDFSVKELELSESPVVGNLFKFKKKFLFNPHLLQRKKFQKLSLIFSPMNLPRRENLNPPKNLLITKE